MPSQQICDLRTADVLEPCTIVIFGASGDLTSRKLIPALYSMFIQDRMPTPFTIVGCSRTDMNDEAFREKLLAGYQKTEMDLTRWHEFAANLHYRSITYDAASFQQLARYLRQLDQETQTKGNRIFDLSVPPRLYSIIATLLGQSGLAEEHGHANGWARIIVEKPFGRDLQSAIELNATLHQYFQEEQIFRIDHYLAKETVQNTLAFRFANSIFEPLWNRNHIDFVGVVAAEKLGVGSRAGYYETSGVLRDMFQNHLMQLLVLTAMEPPWRFAADAVQDEKAKVIRSLRQFSSEQGRRICLGQYSAGSNNGEPLIGYRSEQGVNPNSITPTFALMEVYIDNWRWHNVPFYLISGKRLPRKETKIVIQFKEVPTQLFREVLGETIHANRLIIETYPDEAIRLTFLTKTPGTSICLRPMTMDFTYREHYKGATLDAYARVLLDCMEGDHMLFWREDGIELSWAFLDPILRKCEECGSRDQHLHFYPAGTWGPEPARKTVSLLLDD